MSRQERPAEERGRDDFWARFGEYVRAYLPGWRYREDGGELEAAVLYAAAELIRDSRGRLAMLPQKHEREYLNSWPLEGQPPVPACAFAALSSARWQEVPARSEFYLAGDGGRVWRTVEDTLAGPMELKGQVLRGGRYGKVLALPPPAPQAPTRLFDFRARSGQGQSARFLHPDAFASENGCRVWLALTGADQALLEFLRGGDARWSLLQAEREDAPLASPTLEGQTLRFDLPGAPGAWALEVCCRPDALPPRSPAGLARVTTRRESLPLALAVTDDGVRAEESWLPFGPAPEVWRTCCLSCPDAFALRGGEITLSYTLSQRVREENLPGMERPPEYRPVMRRLPSPPPEARDVWVEAVRWEYWNGAAWFPLPGTKGGPDGFVQAEGPETRTVGTRFRWPEDAAPCPVWGHTALWLRWRVQGVTEGGFLPRRCHAPEVTAPRFSAVLEDAPAAIETRGGLAGDFSPLRGQAAPLFPALGPEEDEWWLGFDGPPEGGLLRMYLSLAATLPGGRLTAWEAAGASRRALTLEDGTDGLAHSGMVTLGDIQGRTSAPFGTAGWWLCFRDESGRLSQGRRFPQLEALVCGAARVESVGGDDCAAGEPLSPLRGGPLTGVTLTGSFGGVGEESEEELLRRARDSRHHLGRAVSSLDVDELIRGAMRDVARTRCVLADGVLWLAVLMRDLAHHTAAFARRRGQIEALVERDGAAASLGLSVAAREPSFYRVNVTVWARSDAPEQTREAARAALDDFLHPVTGHFGGDGWPIGSLPTEMETRNFLRSRLPGAALVKLLLTLTAADGRELNRAQARDPFALPRPGGYTIRVFREEALP